MKKLVCMFVMTATIFHLSGCSKTADTAEPIQYEDSTEITTAMYMGNSGWSVTYDEPFFDMNELVKGQDIELIYKGKCKGTAYVEITEVPGKTAKELIDEKKLEYENTSKIYEAGRSKASGYSFCVPDIVPSKKTENDRYTSVEVVNLKDGALVITASQMMDDEIEVSDRTADIINSIEIK